jgi:hypothetical protein
MYRLKIHGVPGTFPGMGGMFLPGGVVRFTIQHHFAELNATVEKAKSAESARDQENPK